MLKFHVIFTETTESINALLAEKSRENSELQILLSEKSIQFESELESLQNLTDRLSAENMDLKQQVDDGEKELEQRFNREMKVNFWDEMQAFGILKLSANSRPSQRN